MTGATHHDRPRGALVEHVASCSECQADPPVLDKLEALLSSEVDFEVSALSRAVLRAARPELARLGAVAFRRKVAAGVLAALVPLPVILFLNAYLLSAAYAFAALIVPSALAAYLVFSYAALVLLLLALAYGSIPLLVARQLATGSAPLVRNA